MNRLLIIFLLIFSTELYSLEIWLNGNLFENYTYESLGELSYYLPDVDKKGIYLKELLPLMENITSFKFISDDFIVETDMDDTFFISIEENDNLLHGDTLGVIKLPDLLELKGPEVTTEVLTIWMDKDDSYLKREINLFGRLHKLTIEYRVEKNLDSLLEYNLFNNSKIPDLLIYDQEKLNRLSPLLRTINQKLDIREFDKTVFTVNEKLLAVPFKMSRQIFLSDSPGRDFIYLTADFGNINYLYPLFIRFGMDDIIDLRSSAVKDSFFYLTNLYNQGIYQLSTNPESDFISGNMNSFYGSSEVIGNLDNDLGKNIIAQLPQLGGINPPPLLQYKLLSISKESKNLKTSEVLINYLTAYGVQQRVDPHTGYLPYNRDVFTLLNDTSAKDLLLDNLENAQNLSSGEIWDDLRFVLPRIYRLIITGKLTIDEGISEIITYINNQTP